MKRYLSAFVPTGALLAIWTIVAVLATASTAAQPFNTQIQIAINRLTTGLTPFTQLSMAASAYLNWGATLGMSGYGLRDNAGVIETKNSGGAWTPVISGAGAPSDTSFLTRVAEAGLTNETVLASLGTGLLVNTTATGVPTIYAGVTCTNQFLRVLSAIGAGTCASVSLTADVTGTLPVGSGGTGLTSGTSGGILYFSGAAALASSAALTANQLVVGGGAGVAPATLGSLGTTTTLLHGNAAGAPTFGAVDLVADVTGLLPTANGGLNNAFFAISGPSATTKTYTFPNASTTILTTNATITAGQGGTGQSTYTIGDLLQATGAAALSRLAAVSTGNALISGGVATASTWGKIGLTTHVTGTLGATNGGTGVATYTTGDLLYASSATSLAKLVAVATGQFLVSAGVGVAPVWSASPAFTGQLTGPTGNCATAPPYSFTGRTTTGLCSAAVDNWALYAGGSLTIQGNATELTADKTLRPVTTNTIDLGTSSIAWRSIYTASDQFNGGDYRGGTAQSRLNLNTDGAANFADAAGTSWTHLRFGAATTAGWRLNVTGNLFNFREGDDSAFVGAGVSQLNLNSTLTLSATAPTISAGFGTTPSVTAGTAASFRVDVGTGGVATSGTIGVPTAANGWNCHVENLTATLANRADQRTVQISSTTTTIVVENQTVSTGAVLAWTASDILALACLAF